MMKLCTHKDFSMEIDTKIATIDDPISADLRSEKSMACCIYASIFLVSSHGSWEMKTKVLTRDTTCQSLVDLFDL